MPVMPAERATKRRGPDMSRWQPEPEQSFWSWSLPCGSVFGIAVSLHWTLLVMTAFQAFGAVRDRVPWWWLPILLVIPPLSVLLHEFGHAGAARLAGGGCDRIVLWMLGGAAMCEAPPRPWHQFAVAAAGPLVNALIASGCLLALAFVGGRPVWSVGQGYAIAGVLGAILAFAAATNLALLIFNLLPIYPLDGGRMARAALWPFAGRRRAVRWTLVLGWIGVAGIALWGLLGQNILLFAIALMLGLAVWREQVAVRQGYDPEFGSVDAVPERGGTLERWRANRAAAASERDERNSAAEQAELDRLLDKVSQGGLPALSESERRTLRRISEREREKAGR